MTTMTRRITLFLCLLLAAPGWAWGADIYLSKVGGVLKFRSGAWPTATEGTIPSPTDLNKVTFSHVSNGNTLVLDALTYSGSEIDDGDGLDISGTITIRSATSSDPEYETRKGTPVLDGAGLNDNVVSLTGACTLTGIKITGADATKYNFITTANATLNDCVLTAGAYGFAINGAAQVVFNRCEISNHTTMTGDVNGTGATLTMNYCLVKGNSSAIRHYKTAYAGNNNVFSGNGNDHILITGNNAQTAIEKNSIFVSNGTSNTSKYPLENTSADGTGAATNCLILGSGMSKAYDEANNWTVTNSITTSSPLFRSARRPGIISFVVDDAASSTHFATIADLAEQYGFRVTWAVDTDNMNAGRWTTANAYVLRGHDVASHSKSHPDLTSLAAEALATEVAGSKTVIETNITSVAGYACKTFVYPGYQQNEAVRQAVFDAGYIMARSGTTDSESILLSAIGAYKTYGPLVGALFGLVDETPSESDIRRRAASLAEYLNYIGGFVTILMHDGAQNSDMSSANMAFVFDELKKSNISVMTYTEASEWIIANAESQSGVGGNLVYERSAGHLGDASDYRLQATSPARNAGDNAVWSGTANVTDLAGRRITDAAGAVVAPGGVDIGVYENYGRGALHDNYAYY